MLMKVMHNRKNKIFCDQESELYKIRWLQSVRWHTYNIVSRAIVFLTKRREAVDLFCADYLFAKCINKKLFNVAKIVYVNAHMRASIEYAAPI